MAIKRKSFAQRKKEFEEITTGFNKKAGKTLIDTVSNPEIQERLRIEYIPTASMNLNAVIGGWPRGKFSLISGKPDSGKTYRLLEDIGFNMKNDPEFVAVWCESESSIDPDAFEMFGIDIDRFYYFEVGTYGGENALDIVIRYAQSGVDMIVINSLKCLTPNVEFVKNMGEDTIAVQARMNAKFMRIIIPTIAESGTALCAVQHMSTSIGGYGGGNQIIVGGQAIKYNNVLTAEFSKGFIDQKHNLYAVRDKYMPVKVKITKNHCKTLANPYVSIDYIVKLGTGTDITGEVIDAAIEQHIVEKAGAWIKEYKDGIIEKGNERILENGVKCSWNGIAKFNDFVNNNPDYFNYLKDKVEGNITTTSLSEDEIAEIKEQEEMEEEALDKFKEELNEVLETE